MAISFLPPIQAADQDVGYIIVKVLIGVTHIAAVEDQRVIEERTIPVRRLGECCHEMSEHPDMVLVELCVLRDSPRIFTVMRSAVESQRWRFAFRVGPSREVTRKQQCADACDICLEGE